MIASFMAGTWEPFVVPVVVGALGIRPILRATERDRRRNLEEDAAAEAVVSPEVVQARMQEREIEKAKDEFVARPMSDESLEVLLGRVDQVMRGVNMPAGYLEGVDPEHAAKPRESPVEAVRRQEIEVLHYGAVSEPLLEVLVLQGEEVGYGGRMYGAGDHVVMERSIARSLAKGGHVRPVRPWARWGAR